MDSLPAPLFLLSSPLFIVILIAGNEWSGSIVSFLWDSGFFVVGYTASRHWQAESEAVATRELLSVSRNYSANNRPYQP